MAFLASNKVQVSLPITVIVSSRVSRTSYYPFHSIPLLVLGDTQSIKRPGRRAGKCYKNNMTRRRQGSQYRMSPWIFTVVAGIVALRGTDDH